MNSRITDSRAVSKALKDKLRPLLKEIGFRKFVGRRAYRYEGDSVLGFSTNAVGNYFSDVTGFPSASFYATAWVHYRFIPTFAKYPGSPDEAFTPKVCHLSKELLIQNEELKNIRSCSNPKERTRSDVWWIDPNGTNLAESVNDVVEAMTKVAFPWWERMADLDQALAAVEASRSCPIRDLQMYCFGVRLGRSDLVKHYGPLIKDKNVPMAMVHV